MYEHKRQPVIPKQQFVKRLLHNSSISVSIILGSLGIGTLGYHYTESLPWLDAVLNASMILGGMGPVDRVETTGGKIFASGYALFSGVVFLTSVAVLFAPAFHRFIHRFHIEFDAEAEASKRGAGNKRK